MTVLLAICLLMAGAFVGFVLCGVLAVAARDAEKDRKRWWDD